MTPRRRLRAIATAVTATVVVAGAIWACTPDPQPTPIIPINYGHDAGKGGDAAATDAGGFHVDFDGGGTPVTLTFGQCSGSTTCGGKLAGDFVFTAGCLPDLGSAFSRVKQICPATTFSDPSGTIQGTFSFNADAGVQRRNALVTLNASANVPADCANAGGGCANVAAAFTDGQGLTASCDGQDACTCTLQRILPPDKGWTNYATNGPDWIAGDEANEFCIQGSQLTYQGIGATTTDHPGVWTLDKQR